MAPRTWWDDSRTVLLVPASDGRLEAYLARSAIPGRPAIVVLHEVFGVNADLRSTCDELAAEGFTAACPELFWRQERHVDLSIHTPADWEKGLALYEEFDLNSGVLDVEATVAAVRDVYGTSGRVGVMGFCLGGLLTFLTAARTRIDAAVAFHGSRTEEFLGEVPDVDAPLQVHLAEEDEFMSKYAQLSIKAALASNPNSEVFSYRGCHHAFSRHEGANFDADAARLSRARTLKFFNRHLA